MKSLLSLMVYVRRYRWRFIWGILFVLLANAIGTRVPIVVGQVVNKLTANSALLGSLGWICLYIVALTGLDGCFRYLMRRILIDTSRDIEYDFRNDIYRHLQRLDSSFFDGRSTGDIMSRMTNDIDVIRMMIGPAIMYSANTVFTLPIVLFYMFGIDWRVTLAGLVPMLGLPLVVRFVGQQVHRMSRRQQEQMSDLTTFVQESLAGIRVLKAYGQEQPYAGRFLEENERYIGTSMELAKFQSIFFPAIRFLAGMGMLAILAAGAVRVIHGGMNYGDLLTMVMLFGWLVWPLIAAGWVINLFQRAAASMERVEELMKTTSRISDSPAAAAFRMPANLDVEFHDVTFTYPGANHPALRNLSLRIPQGGTLGIVGRVGSGKSTLVHLLLRLYPVESGHISIGGIDIKDWPLETLRKTAGIVFQETFLFSDTLSENIRFGALREISQEGVEDAARKADIHKDIVDFPRKYDTMLGERGINLSGGQKQRVSLARALVRDPRIMILDDSLSAVDTHTEEAILSSLAGVMKDRTTILISHRISTVALADEIVVLEDGRITQRGRHEELTAQPGLYAELHRKQQLEEEVETIGVD